MKSPEISDPWHWRYPPHKTILVHQLHSHFVYTLSKYKSYRPPIPAFYRAFWCEIRWIREEWIVPRKKSTKTDVSSSSGNQRNGKVQWLNIRLEDNDVVEMEAWQIDDADLLVEFIMLLDAGYNISLKNSDDGESVTAFVIGQTEDCIGKGYAFSGWSTDVVGAVKSVMFKYHFKIKGNFEDLVGVAKKRYG